MPALPSSPVNPAPGHLVRLAADAAGEQRGLPEVLARVADPRHRRGVRHRLAGILGLALCAVVAGARSFTAIAEWAADADRQTLHVLGVTGRVPSESTFRRTLQRLDAGAFDDLAGAWAQQATVPGPGQRRVIAVDGKTLRGSASGGEPGDHLLAALDHVHGAVLGQVEVGAKTNEIPMFPLLLGRIDITGAVITADAMHAQRGHATYVAGRGAHYVLTVKRNQCATRRSGTSPPQAGQTRREVCWVRWLTWIRKVKGTRACQLTGGWAQVPGTVRRGTRAVWRKLDCLNPNLQRQQFTATGMAPVTGARRDRGVLVRPGHPSRRERCPARAFKEMSGAPAAALQRVPETNVGSPSQSGWR